LNSTTGNLIASTSRLLKQQAARTHEQAASSAISLDQLKQAFQNIYETMDAIATYKTQALGTMKQTVELLSHEVDKAKTHLDRVRSEQQAEVVKEFELSGSDEIRF